MYPDKFKDQLDLATDNIDYLLAKTGEISAGVGLDTIRVMGYNSVANAIMSTKSNISDTINASITSMDELRARLTDLETKFEYISNIGLPPVFDMFSPTEVFSILVKSKAAEELSEQESKTLDRIISSLAAYILINKINN